MTSFQNQANRRNVTSYCCIWLVLRSKANQASSCIGSVMFCRTAQLGTTAIIDHTHLFEVGKVDNVREGDDVVLYSERLEFP